MGREGLEPPNPMGADLQSAVSFGPRTNTIASNIIKLLENHYFILGVFDKKLFKSVTIKL